MAYLLDDPPLLFMAHPRTASRALSTYILSRGGRKLTRSHHDGADPAAYPGHTSVCVVRNHFDALVSWWHKHGHRGAFGDYVRGFFLAPSGRDYAEPHRLWPFAPRCERALRFERLGAELEEIFGEPATLPEVGVSEERTDRSDPLARYDAATEAFVRGMFYHEMHELGYYE